MNISTRNPIQAGDKVRRDSTTENEGKVQLGDYSPAF